METNHIQFLRTVAEHGNISSAAREIGLTQPALTKIVLRVEDIVGAKLFERKSRGVRLTPYGDMFLQRMETVEREMLSLTHEVRAMKAGLSGTVSIGIGQVWIGNIIPNVVARLTKALPEVQVKISTGARDELLHQLQRGKLDFLLSRFTDDLPEGMQAEALADVKLYLVVRSGHPLAQLGRPVSLEDLEPYGWVLPPPTDPTAIHLDQVFRTLGTRQRPGSVEAVSQNLTIGLLKSTDLIGAMTEITVSKFGEGLHRLETDWLDWTRRAGVISLKDRSLLPCCTKFLEILREEIQ